MLVSLGLHAWDAMHRRGATSEARSEPTGHATHLLLHQDTLCCTPPGQERSAASHHWLLLHPLVKSLPFSNCFKSWFAQGLVVQKIEQLLLHNPLTLTAITYETEAKKSARRFIDSSSSVTTASVEWAMRVAMRQATKCSSPCSTLH